MQLFGRIDKKGFFYFSIIFHVSVYWIGALVAYLVWGWFVFSDLYQTALPAIGQFLVDPRAIYTILADSPYRNLPSLLLYGAIFYMQGSVVANYISAASALFVWNLGACALIFKILPTINTHDAKKDSLLRNPYMIASIYMLVPWQFMSYLMGNTEIICGFFVLVGLYFFIKKRENWAFFAFSIAIHFKLLAIFFLILLLFSKSFKNIVTNVLFVIIAQVPNIILFLMYPSLLSDYILQNLNTTVEITSYKNLASGSFARNLSALCSLPLLPTVIMVAMVMIPLQFYYVLKEHGTTLTQIDKIFIIVLTCIAIVPDFYTLHVFVLLGTYLMWLSTGKLVTNRFVKCMPMVATFFITPWLVFPYLSIFYFIPLIYMDYLLLKKPTAVVEV